MIPVYNREDWVGTAIDSVLGQSCGTDRLEVVLVDDGSTDSSGQILDDYATFRADKVTVVHQANAGVAAALNAGVAVATGDIVGFLGSDDYLSPDALQGVLEFYDDHWDEVDLVAIKIQMVGSRHGLHWNNGQRFDRTRVINVWDDWNMPQMSGGGTFVKRSVFTERGLSFDPLLFITEDATLNTQVIMDKMAYGVLAEPTYYNRRYAEGGASLVANSHFRKDFYTIVPEHAYARLFSDARQRFGHIPNYVQAICLYDLVFRFRANTSVLTPEEHAAYVEVVKGLLKQVSVYVLMKQKALIEQRLNMLDLREDNDLAQRLSFSGGVFSLENTRVYSFDPEKRARHKPPTCIINFLEVLGDSVRIRGTLSTLRLTPGTSFEMRVGTHSYPLELEPPLIVKGDHLTRTYVAGERFCVTVPFASGQSLQVIAQVDSNGGRSFETPLRLTFGRHSRFSGTVPSGYFRHDGDTVLRQRGKYTLTRQRVDERGAARAEAGFARRALKAGMRPRTAALRVLATALQRRTHDEIWLLADHKLEAGDNGEAMFRYLASHPETGVTPVLALSASAPNHAELSRLAEVVEPDSRAFFRRLFQATVLLNSAADEYMINPLGPDRVWFADLLPTTAVFLQHGITKDDQSAWLNKDQKGFDLFVTSAHREWESIAHGPYGYQEDEVALVGMPRFDRLTSAQENLVVFAPTWRKHLAGALDAATGRNRSTWAFGQSDYFRLWQDIIRHPRLNAALGAAGYTGVFALHPSHSAELKRFKAGPHISIAAYPYDYQDLLQRGSVMVTDYSSVVFDFAYLRKPVVYLQPDREEFFSGHLYDQGYFSYDDDGFGPVIDTVDGLVAELIQLIAQDGQMPAEYRRRADAFFAFEGGGNCERLYHSIRRSQHQRQASRAG